MSLPPLLVLSGLPGCGKTTQADRLQHQGWRVLSRDAIREKMFSGEPSDVGKRLAWSALLADLRETTPTPTVLDGCPFARAEQRSAVLDVAAGRFDLLVVHFDLTPDQASVRIAKQSHHPALDRQSSLPFRVSAVFDPLEVAWPKKSVVMMDASERVDDIFNSIGATVTDRWPLLIWPSRAAPSL